MEIFSESIIFLIISSSAYCYEINSGTRKLLKGYLCKENKFETCGAFGGSHIFSPHRSILKISKNVLERHCSSMTRMTECLVRHAELCESLYEATYARMSCHLCSDPDLYKKIEDNIDCIYSDHHRYVYEENYCKTTSQEILLQYLYIFSKRKSDYFPEMSDKHFWRLLNHLVWLHDLGCYLSYLTCKDKAVEEDIMLEGAVILYAPVKGFIDYYKEEAVTIMKFIPNENKKLINDTWSQFENKCKELECDNWKQQSNICWSPEWFYPKE